MNKIILFLAGMWVATVFAPEAAALPVFARQTGLACQACHFQHFPALNSFGRAFRVSGYTMMGVRGRVEGEHLSLPDTLNASTLVKMRYQKPGGLDTAGGLRAPFIFDMGPIKIGVTPYLSDTQGASYADAQSRLGQVWAGEYAGAQSYTGLGTGAGTGITFSTFGDMGYVALSRFPLQYGVTAGTNAVQFKADALRIAATPTVGNWVLHIGGGLFSGSAYPIAINAAPLADAVASDIRGAALDFHAQGQLGSKDVSVYANYAKAPASGATANFYNALAIDKKAFVIAADYSVIPYVLRIGAAYRNANTGAAVAGTPDKYNAFSVTAVYDLYQNVALHVNHMMQNGSAYSATGTKAAAMLGGGEGRNLTTLMLEAAW